TLQIKLTEQITKENYKQTTTNKNTTLGDIAIIKRR
ncbi:TIGR00270 family protein, partial [Methanosarcinales archaeon]